MGISLRTFDEWIFSINMICAYTSSASVHCLIKFFKFFLKSQSQSLRLVDAKRLGDCRARENFI